MNFKIEEEVVLYKVFTLMNTGNGGIESFDRQVALEVQSF